MTAKYCVFGEGKNDIGEVEWGGGGKLSQEGCYSGFLKATKYYTGLKCLKAVELKEVGKTSDNGKIKSLKTKTKQTKKAYFASRMAATEGADVLIIGRDVDKANVPGSRHLDRVRCVKKYREEFEAGYTLACKDDPAVERVHLVVIVPLCELEAWLLADEKAFSAVAGFQRGKLTQNPEEIHGETGAKEYLDSLFLKHGRKAPDTPVLYKIATKSSPAVLKRMCPVSYAPFLEQCKS